MRARTGRGRQLVRPLLGVLRELVRPNERWKGWGGVDRRSYDIMCCRDADETSSFAVHAGAARRPARTRHSWDPPAAADSTPAATDSTRAATDSTRAAADSTPAAAGST